LVCQVVLAVQQSKCSVHVGIDRCHIVYRNETCVAHAALTY